PASMGCCDYMPLFPMRKIVDPPASPPSVRLVAVGTEHDGQRLANFLFRLCKGVPKSHAYKAIRDGQVRDNKGRCRAETRLSVGVSVRTPALRLTAPGTSAPVPPTAVPVLYEDANLLVIDKPAGVAVHGGSGVS